MSTASASGGDDVAAAAAAPAVRLAQTTEDGGRVIHVRAYLAEGPAETALSYRQGAALLATSAVFAEQLSSLLRDAPHAAFFFETPPVTPGRADSTPFEFVLVDAAALARKQPSPEAFTEHFSACRAAPTPEPIAVFQNLGGDATLVVPCPPADGVTAPLEAYTHLASFVRSGPAAQVAALWQALGKQLQARLSPTASPAPVWCSTSGLGVYWLHVRLDARPKYYTYDPFRSKPK